jgi:RHS repeat-associated protein
LEVQETLKSILGAQALTGTRSLHYAFDDHIAGAKSNGSVPTGNGNLMYTVSHDSSSGKHTVRWESYTSFNMPREFKYGNIGVTAKTPEGATSDRTLAFVYGPEHQRVKQTVTLTANAPTNMMGGTTWYLHGQNNALLFEKELKANGVTENRHYLQAAGMTFAMVTTRSGAGVSSTASDPSKRSSQVRYFHQDHLGSMSVITDEAGQVVERLAYDPWGKRRKANGLADKSDSLVGVNTDRGYTEHEHLDEIGLIHMNGRVYDPLIGRFMSADPFIQAPDNLQSYNRYAYVMNNPLAYTDPSGFISLKKLFRIAVVVGVAYFTGGAAAAWYEGAAAATTLGGGTAFTIAGGDFRNSRDRRWRCWRCRCRVYWGGIGRGKFESVTTGWSARWFDRCFVWCSRWSRRS